MAPSAGGSRSVPRPVRHALSPRTLSASMFEASILILDSRLSASGRSCLWHVHGLPFRVGLSSAEQGREAACHPRFTPRIFDDAMDAYRLLINRNLTLRGALVRVEGGLRYPGRGAQPRSTRSSGRRAALAISLSVLRVLAPRPWSRGSGPSIHDPPPPRVGGMGRAGRKRLGVGWNFRFELGALSR